MTAHTPGPWVVLVGDDDTQPITIGTGEGHVGRTDDLAEVFSREDSLGPSTTKEEARANARLIAAAPDLLAALKQQTAALVASGYHPDSKAIIDARAAIAKAEGG